MKRLCEVFPVAKGVINNIVLSRHQIELKDLPSWYDSPGRVVYKAALSRDYITSGAGDVHTLESLMPEQKKPETMVVDGNSDLASPSDKSSPMTRSPEAIPDNEESLARQHYFSRSLD